VAKSFVVALCRPSGPALLGHVQPLPTLKNEVGRFFETGCNHKLEDHRLVLMANIRDSMAT